MYAHVNLSNTSKQQGVIFLAIQEVPRRDSMETCIHECGNGGTYITGTAGSGTVLFATLISLNYIRVLVQLVSYTRTLLTYSTKFDITHPRLTWASVMVHMLLLRETFTPCNNKVLFISIIQHKWLKYKVSKDPRNQDYLVRRFGPCFG